jgi:hypothetical protein
MKKKLEWYHWVGLIAGGFAAYEIIGFMQCALNRPMIHFAKENYAYPMRIAEIGVFNGANAIRMFQSLNVETMYLIDPYLKYDGYSKERLMFPFLPKNFDVVMDKLGEYADHAIPFQMTSEEASPYIPNDLDMVYIDGNHAYEYVKKDIELYTPKVKHGGLIGGHDYQLYDVQRAVCDFAYANNYYVHVALPDWWIVLD